MMLHTKIPLGTNKADDTPYMTTYILDQLMENQKKKPIVIIFPGGGYGYRTPREGEPIACEFNSIGCHAVVVEYSVNAPYPQSLIDASNAVIAVRDHAEEWNIDTNKIFVCGFSAGAHLAASIGTMWNKEPAIKRADRKNRPDGMILSYPVITSGQFAHRGSFDNIGATTTELLEKTSIDLQVDSDTPPAFIWHTFADNAVPVENSLLLANAMRAHHVPFELHIYPEGQHGLSLAKDFTAENEGGVMPHVQSWMCLAKKWLELFM